MRRGGIADPGQPYPGTLNTGRAKWKLVQSSSGTQTEVCETQAGIISPALQGYTCSVHSITAPIIVIRLNLTSSSGLRDTGYHSIICGPFGIEGNCVGRPLRGVGLWNSQAGMSIILKPSPAKPHRLKAIHLPNLFFRLFYGSKSFTFDLTTVS